MPSPPRTAASRAAQSSAATPPHIWTVVRTAKVRVQAAAADADAAGARTAAGSGGFQTISLVEPLPILQGECVGLFRRRGPSAGSAPPHSPYSLPSRPGTRAPLVSQLGLCCEQGGSLVGTLALAQMSGNRHMPYWPVLIIDHLGALGATRVRIKWLNKRQAVQVVSVSDLLIGISARKTTLAVADRVVARYNADSWYLARIAAVRTLDRGTMYVSFTYRYLSRESCSQFDSLPLTSLTIPRYDVRYSDDDTGEDLTGDRIVGIGASLCTLVARDEIWQVEHAAEDVGPCGRLVVPPPAAEDYPSGVYAGGLHEVATRDRAERGAASPAMQTQLEVDCARLRFVPGDGGHLLRVRGALRFAVPSSEACRRTASES